MELKLEEMKMKPLKVVVERSKWLRGVPNSALLKGNQFCCLGFACLTLGLKEEQIRNVGNPYELLNDDLREIPYLAYTGDYSEEELNFQNKRYIRELIEINDNENITENLREQKLKEMGSRANIEFEFVD